MRPARFAVLIAACLAALGLDGCIGLKSGLPERSLRRAAELGAIRGRRLSERRFRLADGEIDYLRNHWPVFVELREALRTEPRVRLAVLFGSVARGDDDASSDVDLLVDFSPEVAFDRLRLSARLQERTGRSVDVASLNRARRSDPFFLLQAVDDGRVVVDRDRLWPDVRDGRSALYKRATRAYAKRQAEAADAIRKLTDRQ